MAPVAAAGGLDEDSGAHGGRGGLGAVSRRAFGHKPDCTDQVTAGPGFLDAVPIGEAVALYRLAPSTLRWWERQGVVAPTARRGGRRVRHSRPGGWRRTMRAETERLDERVERLTAARVDEATRLGLAGRDGVPGIRAVIAASGLKNLLLLAESGAEQRAAM